MMEARPIDDILTAAEAQFEPFPCPTCGVSFEYERDVREHVAAVHPDARASLSCPVCGEDGFPSEYILQIHTDARHATSTVQVHASGSAPLSEEGTTGSVETCSDCGKEFARGAGIAAHRRAAHPLVRCQDCGSEWPTVRAMAAHQRQEHSPLARAAEARDADPEMFVCLVFGCDFESPEKLAVQEHVGGVHPKCDLCRRRFLNDQELAVHTESEHSHGQPTHERDSRKDDTWERLRVEYVGDLVGLVAAVPDDDFFARVELLLSVEGNMDPLYRLEVEKRRAYIDRLIGLAFDRDWSFNEQELWCNRIETLLGWEAPE